MAMDSTEVRGAGTPASAASGPVVGTPGPPGPPAPGAVRGPVRGTARLRRARRTIRIRRVLRSRWDLLLVIALGGAVGSLARWGLARAWPARSGHVPWATLVANLSGCLFLGVLMVLVLDVLPTSRYARPFLGTGVLGGYTTFSTAMLDVRTQLVGGHPELAGAYLAGSLAFGSVAVWLGMVCARLAVSGARARSRNRSRRGR